MQPGVHAAAPVGVVDAGSSVEAGRRGGEGGGRRAPVSPVVSPRNKR